MPVEWSTLQLRFSGFFAEDSSFDAAVWWTELTGEKPEEVTDKPKAALQQAVGPYADGVLLLQLKPKRIDCLHHARVEGLEEFPDLGLIEGVAGSFEELIKGWLRHQHLPDFSRIAFGAQAFRRTDSRADAYRLLADYLPAVRVDAEQSTDIVYQVNRWRESKEVPGLQLNRLAKWSGSLLEITAKEKHSRASQAATRYHPAANLDLDINTSGEREEPLPRESLVPLFGELVALGLEIAEKGDEP